jgi:hypothetical protein
MAGIGPVALFLLVEFAVFVAGIVGFSLIDWRRRRAVRRARDRENETQRIEAA